MKFTKQQIAEGMHEIGIVPLLTHENSEVAQQAMEAAYRGGARVFEFTNRKKNSFEVFAHLLTVADKLPGLMLGIGTIMDGPTTEKYIQAGAHFIISPMLKAEMAAVCHAHNIHWIPGCATVTEVVTARDQGAEIIKIFPGSVVGPQFVTAVLSVVPGLRLMVTGGVEPTEKSLSEWFAAGAMCAGMGSQLFTREIFDKKDWHKLEIRIKESITIVKRIRSQRPV